MKKDSLIAEKYAQAIFEIAYENKLTKEFSEALTKVSAEISASDFEVLKNSPMGTQISFKEMIKTALASAVNDKYLESFLLILVDNGRLGLLSEISKQFNKKVDSQMGIVRGEVRSSRALKDAEVQKLTSAVEENLNQKVDLKFNVDPNLIGGFEINVGGYQFVDSIRGHLNKLNEVVRRSSN